MMVCLDGTPVESGKTYRFRCGLTLVAKKAYYYGKSSFRIVNGNTVDIKSIDPKKYLKNAEVDDYFTFDLTGKYIGGRLHGGELDLMGLTQAEVMYSARSIKRGLRHLSTIEQAVLRA